MNKSNGTSNSSLSLHPKLQENIFVSETDILVLAEEAAKTETSSVDSAFEGINNVSKAMKKASTVRTGAIPVGFTIGDTQEEGEEKEEWEEKQTLKSDSDFEIVKAMKPTPMCLQDFKIQNIDSVQANVEKLLVEFVEPKIAASERLAPYMKHYETVKPYSDKTIKP